MATVESSTASSMALMMSDDNIKAWPLLAATASPANVLDDIARLEAIEIDDSFGASYGEAVEAKAVSLAKLREIHAAKVAAETKRVADAVAAQQLHDMATQRATEALAEINATTAPVVFAVDQPSPADALRHEIDEITEQMTVAELKLVLHFCNRSILGRQVAA